MANGQLLSVFRQVAGCIHNNIVRGTFNRFGGTRAEPLPNASGRSVDCFRTSHGPRTAGQCSDKLPNWTRPRLMRDFGGPG